MAWVRTRIPARVLCLGVVIFAFNITSAVADYLLQPGDIVEVTVQGVPELKRRALIREDGYIPFPLIGSVEFANQTLLEVRNRICDVLTARDIVAFPDVTVDLIEVRPLYILGDVARPGSYPFKPEYTIRHAVALAGGLESASGRNRGGLFETVTLASEF